VRFKVIGLYLSEMIPRGTAARETCERIRDQGGIVYLPHPYAPGKGSPAMADELAALSDVVEVFNGRIHRQSLNRRALELARRHARLRGGGSDAHTVREVGRTWVETPRHPNRPDALLEALASARVSGRASSVLVHLASTWARMRKRLPGAPSLDTWRGAAQRPDVDDPVER
jgi:predicted metal-dependent phosphoesterase TrpH